MKHFALLLSLLPTTALAGFECQVVQQCGGGECAPYPGGPILVEEVGDIWEITADGQVWQGYVTTSLEGLAEISIVAPPQNGTSALITIHDSGAALFTFHALNGMEPIAITGQANCAGTGG